MTAALRTTTPQPDCEHCNDTRIISSPRLGSIRCPYCTKAPLARTNWREFNAAEKRRLEREQHATAVVVTNFRLPGIPNHLLATDRILTRWGCDGSGMPAEDPEAYRESLPVPLDPNTYVVVNRVVRQSPHRVRRFAIDWYCSYNPTYVMEKNWKLSRRQLGRVQLLVLNALKARFLMSRHEDLIALVKFLPE